MEVKLFDSLEAAKKVLNEKEPRLVKANGITICVVWVENKLMAFHNQCPHMGADLHQGKVNYINEIVCPLHTYRFNLQTGEESEDRCAGLRFVPITSNEKGVFLEL